MTGPSLLALWARCRRLPFGATMFSLLLGWMVPYTGTVGARIAELRPGYARATLRDRRKVRNHLRSIHAIALANLGEVTSGLALNTALDDRTRAILIALSVDYLKKARGPLVAECTAPPAEPGAERDYDVVAEIRDDMRDVVARVTARWRAGPARLPSS